MDAFIYFFLNLGIYNLFLALLSLLIGLFLGKALWGFDKIDKQIEIPPYSPSENQTQEDAEITLQKQNNADLQSQLERFKKHCEELLEKTQSYREKNKKLIIKLQSINTEKKALEKQLDKITQNPPEILEKDADALKQKNKRLKKDLQNCLLSYKKIEQELLALKSLKDKQNKPAPPKEASAFQEQLQDGSMHTDAKLGALYTQAPEKQDDLTQIKGIGKILQHKLNDFGVYTFRQIALWNNAIISEFSERLTFKDRAKRDNWVSQARQFHKEKYKEEI